MGKNSILIILLLVFAQGQAYYSDKETVDFDQFAQLIQESKAQNVNELLPEIKAQHSDLFSRYTLAYRSRSLQGALPQFPRAILFTNSGDFAMAFNGHPRLAGYENLEVMRFNNKTYKYEFYEVSFEQQKAQLSTANPARCLACHQSTARKDTDPRPNWEPYSVWPGFFGSLDDDTDLFINSIKRDKRYNKDKDWPFFAEVYQEKEWLKHFENNIQPTHPRYQLLNTLAANYYDQTDSFLNADLTVALAQNNFKRVARMIRKYPKVYEQIKWTVAAFARCGTSLFIPDETYEWLKQRTIFNDPKIASQEPPQYSGLGFEIYGEKVKIEPPKKIYPYATTSDVITLLTEPFGIDTQDWSMDFKSSGGSLAFKERFGMPTNTQSSFLKALKEVWGDEWQSFSKLRCKELEQISKEKMSDIESLNKLRQSHWAEEYLPLTNRKPLLSQCISCHTQYDGYTPQIPFDEPQTLAKMLKKSGYQRGTLLDEIRFRVGTHAPSQLQMPPRSYIGPTAREDLLLYLENLIAPN